MSLAIPPQVARLAAEHERRASEVWAELTPEERARARAYLERTRVNGIVEELAERLEVHLAGRTEHARGCGFPDLVCECREEERSYLEESLARYQDELERLGRTT